MEKGPAAFVRQVGVNSLRLSGPPATTRPSFLFLRINSSSRRSIIRTVKQTPFLMRSRA